MSDPQNAILKILFENEERLRQTMTREGTAMPGGILPVGNGGTGLAVYAVGDLIYASATTTLTRLADVAAGRYLRSGGVNTAPLWSTLTMPNTAATGSLLHASSTDTITALADAAVGNVLRAKGAGVVPAYEQVVLTTDVTGILPGANGGSGANLATAYATATYTPTYLGGTTAGVTTYTTQQGAYVRFGALVVVTGTVIWTAATGTGLATIGLPFTAQNVANQNFSGSIRLDSVTFPNGTPQSVLLPNTAEFVMVSPITNAASGAVNVEAAGNIVFTISYFI